MKKKVTYRVATKVFFKNKENKVTFGVNTKVLYEISVL